MTKTKVHTRYYTKDGDMVVGTTTVLQVLAKPSLIRWAWNCGIKGDDYTKVRDLAGEVGTITHLLITSELQNIVPDLSEYRQIDIDAATLCLNSFHEWRKSHTLEVIHVEKFLVSEVYRYGGTPDFCGYVNGELELMDFKTSNGIWNDYFYQLAAYRQLEIEQGNKVEKARILRFSKGNNVEFEDRLITQFSKEFELFRNCLNIYNLLKDMKRTL
ncbi:MAG: hypothetical protein WC479_10050 [Candidatus Izemoplasmatales bacterium]